MPHFYFDIRDGSEVFRDEVGDDFESLSHVRAQVQELLPDLARDQPFGEDRWMIACDVRDADGSLVYRGELIYREKAVDARPAGDSEADLRPAKLGRGRD